MGRNATQVAAAGALGLVIGFGFALANGQDIGSALAGGLVIGIIAGAIVALLVWAMAVAHRKGYAAWVGVVALLVFNLPGLVVLMLLPPRRSENQ